MGKPLDSEPIEQEVKNLYGDVEFDHNALNPDAPNSRVYRFKIKANNEVKVIKVLTGSFREKDKDVYEREKQAMLSCKDDKVITFEADGIVGKNYYFVFPFIEGKTLNDLLRTRGVIFGEEDIYAFIKNVIATITNLYKCGIVHQDIKPANIIYRQPNEYLILDLGISLFIKEDPSLKKGKGPLHYLSPEQVELCIARKMNTQNNVNFPSDYYSLGLIGLEMLTGKKIDKIVPLDKIHELCDVVNTDSSISPRMKKLFNALLNQSPIERLKLLREIEDFDLPITENTQIDSLPWIQLVGKDERKFLIEEYFNEFDPKDIGVILSGDQIQNDELALKDLEPFIAKGLKIVIDPRTMRLYDDNVSYLNKRDYYGPMDDTELSKAVFEFESKFNPSFFISPYFYVNSDHCHELHRCILCHEHFIKMGVDPEKLFFGIALSESLMSNDEQLQRVINFLAMCEKFKNIYVLFGTKKSSVNGPITDVKWLSGVKRFLENVGLTKKVFWSLSDLTSFYHLGNGLSNFSIAPSAAGRKCDFEKWNQKTGGGGIPKPRCFMPQLLNDIYIDVELFRLTPHGRMGDNELKYDGVFYGKGVRNDNVKRAHFTEVIAKEKAAIAKEDPSKIRSIFVERLKKAEQLYPELEKKYGFQFHENTNSSFISTWLSVLK